jgi:hypothetical protein
MKYYVCTRRGVYFIEFLFVTLEGKVKKDKTWWRINIYKGNTDVYTKVYFENPRKVTTDLTI